MEFNSGFKGLNRKAGCVA